MTRQPPRGLTLVGGGRGTRPPRREPPLLDVAAAVDAEVVVVMQAGLGVLNRQTDRRLIRAAA